MEEIKIKYLVDIEHIEKITVGDWIDLRVAEDTVLGLGEYKKIPLGIAMELPAGYEAIVAPRSSTFEKYGIILVNGIGIIDETYCGDNDQWHFPALCLKTNGFRNGKPITKIPKGERICQFRILKHQPEIQMVETETLDNTDRGGLGSTGRK